MKKKWRIFFFVIYFLFTFILGIMIALVLPGVNFDILQYQKMNDFVETKQFVYAMDLIGGLYNEEKVKHIETDEDSGIVIFEADSFYLKTNEDKSQTQLINNAYVCFVYGIDNVEAFSHESLNVSRVVFNDKEDWSIELDNYYEELKSHTVETLINSNYICFSIDKMFCDAKGFDEVGSIKIYDANNNLYEEFLLDNNLDFSGEFFEQTSEFVDKYNEFYSDRNFSTEENTVLENILKEIQQVNPHCIKSGTYVYDEIYKEANEESIIFVLIYFIWVYILGDFLVGPRYILRFLTFLFRKIKPIKVKANEEVTEPVLGFGFISTVSIDVKVPEGFEEDVSVMYEHTVNPEYNFKTVITRTVDYKKKERVHGGSYKLISVTCPGFEVVNLPEILEVKGYTMKLSFEIKHKND